MMNRNHVCIAAENSEVMGGVWECYFFRNISIMIRKIVTEMVEPCGAPFSWKKVSENELGVFT